ncbi:MAG: hypothetical protein ACJ8F7_20560, partial [Gemmataceae bacterium]
SEQPPFSPLWLENNAPGARYLDESHTYVLTWKTEETDARVPKSLDEVREKVVTAWKQQKARALAEEAANALQKKVRDEGIRDRAKLLDVAKQNNVEPIELEPLARIRPKPTFQPGVGPGYDPPSIPPDKVEYPTTDMLIKILDLRDKPKGETIVVADEPKLHYYVTVLLDVQDPSADEFIKVYARSAPDTSPFAGGSDPLLRQLEYERRASYRKEIMIQLRKDVKLTINEEEVNKRDKGGSSSEE